MDPNANVAEQWAILADAERHTSQDSFQDANDVLMELREALMEWYRKGGFKPDRKAPSTIEILKAGFNIYSTIS